MGIKENIKRIRESKGIKSKELAEMLNVSPSVVSVWETKKEPASMKTLKKIADALGVSVFELAIDKEALMNNARVLDSLGFDFIDLELVSDFHELNRSGKEEALKRVHELTLIKKYTDPEEGGQADPDL